MIMRIWNKLFPPLLRMDNPISPYPFPFIRKPTPIDGEPNWYMHDGLDCPVLPDTFIGIPSNVYHCSRQDGLRVLRASSFKWRWNDNFHLRNDIHSFKVLSEEDL